MLAAEAKDPQAGSPSLPLVRTFYPAAREIDAADSIAVRGGSVMSGIDIAIQEGSTYSITGIVAQGLQGHPYKIYLQSKAGVSEFRTIPVGQDGSFSVTGLPPGLYGLELVHAAKVVCYRQDLLFSLMRRCL